MALLHIISLYLPKLYDCHYSSLVTKYFLHTSILLDPSCSSVKNSTNSLNAYSKYVSIKKMTKLDFQLNTLLTWIYTIIRICLIFPIPLQFFYNKCMKSQEIPTIRYVVPFPQMCKYQEKDYNPWNEILYKPKTILFCNVDSKNFYKWWNFAAIIDFKWKTYGRFYYFLIWFFYTIFFICFALAVTALHQILMIFIIIYFL